MTYEEIARLIGNSIDSKKADIMVAIALAESEGNTRNVGDPSTGKISCNGYASFGLWQIYMPKWTELLETYTKSKNPCEWAKWLMNPNNNAKAALKILREKGFRMWSKYNNGDYKKHLKHA